MALISNGLCNAARAVALGRKAFLEARDHAKTRRQFDREICEFQGLQWKFADMHMRLESAQMLLMRAVVKADSGLPSAQDTALAASWRVTRPDFLPLMKPCK